MKTSGLVLFFMIFILNLIGCSTLTIPPTETATHQAHNVIISKKVWIDRNFSAPEQKLILQSFKNWETATYGVIQFDLITDFDVNETDAQGLFHKTILRKVSKNDDLVKMLEAQIAEDDNDYSMLDKSEDETGKPVIYGFFLKREGLEHILIVEDRMLYDDGKLREKFFSHVVLHEIGHSIGLQHYDRQLAAMNTGDFNNLLHLLMQHSVEPVTYPTSADLMQVCHLYFCNPMLKLK